MNINRKIEEIRSRPESVRVKYVWGAVGFCMLIIIGIWFISIRTMFHQNETTEDFSTIREQIEQTTSITPSISELSSQINLEQTQLSEEGTLPIQQDSQAQTKPTGIQTEENNFPPQRQND